MANTVKVGGVELLNINFTKHLLTLRKRVQFIVLIYLGIITYVLSWYKNVVRLDELFFEISRGVAQMIPI